MHDRPDRNLTPSSDEVWGLIRVHIGSEQTAIEHLRRQGFATYYPRALRLINHESRKQRLLRPMFPGYMFVAITSDPDSWRPIMSTRGVRELVRMGTEVARVPDDLIADLRRREMPSSDVTSGNSELARSLDEFIARIAGLGPEQRIVALLELVRKSQAKA